MIMPLLSAHVAKQYTDAELAAAAHTEEVTHAYERYEDLYNGTADWQEEYPDHTDEEGALLSAEDELIEEIHAAVAALRTATPAAAA